MWVCSTEVTVDGLSVSACRSSLDVMAGPGKPSASGSTVSTCKVRFCLLELDLGARGTSNILLSNKFQRV